MKIKFLTDYRGVLTAEQFYNAGDIVDFDDDTQAVKLIKAGRCVEVSPAPPKPAPRKRTTRKKAASK